MADNTTIHMNDAGVVFLITVKDENGVVDLTTVQNITLFLQKPDRSVISRNCDTIIATSGLIRYISTFEDFDMAGRWKVQVVVMFADDNIKHSDIGSLTVEKNISF